MEPTSSALDELANDASSRKRFLRMAGGGAVAATLAATIAACGGDKETGDVYGGAGVGTKQFGQGDAGIVGYALFLERLEVAFYEGALASGKLTGRAAELAKRFGEEERTHIRSLEGALRQLGGKEPKMPELNFVFENQPAIVNTAAQLESTGAGAYLGQVRRIKSKQVLSVALSIHSVEARHAASLAVLRGQEIAPDGAFASPVTSADVQSQVQPFLGAG